MLSCPPRGKGLVTALVPTQNVDLPAISFFFFGVRRGGEVGDRGVTGQVKATTIICVPIIANKNNEQLTHNYSFCLLACLLFLLSQKVI